MGFGENVERNENRGKDEILLVCSDANQREEHFNNLTLGLTVAIKLRGKEREFSIAMLMSDSR